MYILNKPLAWIGIGIGALSTVFCPFLKVPLVGNWNLYQTDVNLFGLSIGLLALSVALLFIRKVNAFRIVTWIFAGWTVIGFVAVYFKINNYFGMKIVDGMLAKTLHLKWGWFFLFLSALILMLSVRKLRAVKD
ncbi:hypothetical protein FAZ19_05600 [Sphingobacterium alkalisoli]|uniref:DUF4293 family protein n=1 Tax=Sphingobacterium alkalisoli TaxID=1874115 RepID=A0A4U0HA84_9SPHI|nr:hypothetical protein [Sphingobacterium alkalisoli]TJY68728.1 hypothetical protein FAZ19_05600 [Sphingobacterium alkalisoli]GGH04508.1 hypothetical protein GCM10011418_00190 [Sphingobacterium alkalisoli]